MQKTIAYVSAHCAWERMGDILPQENVFKFRPSEVVSGDLWLQNACACICSWLADNVDIINKRNVYLLLLLSWLVIISIKLCEFWGVNPSYTSFCMKYWFCKHSHIHVGCCVWYTYSTVYVNKMITIQYSNSTVVLTILNTTVVRQ